MVGKGEVEKRMSSINLGSVYYVTPNSLLIYQ